MSYQWCTGGQLAEMNRRRDEVSAALREYYRKNGMMEEERRMHRDLQETITAAQEMARVTGHPVTIEVVNYSGRAVIVPQKPSEPEKKKEVDPREIRDPVSKRIGDEMRDRHIDHLREMRAQGYISQDVFDARLESAMEAVSLGDLAKLVQDLPALPERKVIPEPERPHSASVAFGMAGATMGILALIGALSGPANSAAMAILCLSITWGVIFFVLSVALRRK